MQRIVLSVLVTIVMANAGSALAQSYNDALRDLGRFVTDIDRAHAASAPAGLSALSLRRDAWHRLRHTPVKCARPPVVNGAPTALHMVGPFERRDGTDFTILSRGFGLTWGADATRGASLLLARKFDAQSGQPVGPPFLEGSYLAGEGAVPVGIVGPDRWVDVPRTTSAPPLHQPWGPFLAALARHLRSCD